MCGGWEMCGGSQGCSVPYYLLHSTSWRESSSRAHQNPRPGAAGGPIMIVSNGCRRRQGRKPLGTRGMTVRAVTNLQHLVVPHICSGGDIFSSRKSLDCNYISRRVGDGGADRGLFWCRRRWWLVVRRGGRRFDGFFFPGATRQQFFFLCSTASHFWPTKPTRTTRPPPRRLWGSIQGPAVWQAAASDSS